MLPSWHSTHGQCCKMILLGAACQSSAHLFKSLLTGPIYFLLYCFCSSIAPVEEGFSWLRNNGYLPEQSPHGVQARLVSYFTFHLYYCCLVGPYFPMLRAHTTYSSHPMTMPSKGIFPLTSLSVPVCCFTFIVPVANARFLIFSSRAWIKSSSREISDSSPLILSNAVCPLNWKRK